VDDDVIYDEHMVETLVDRAPDDGALGFGCEQVPMILHAVQWFYPKVIWWTSLGGCSLSTMYSSAEAGFTAFRESCIDAHSLNPTS